MRGSCCYGQPFCALTDWILDERLRFAPAASLQAYRFKSRADVPANVRISRRERPSTCNQATMRILSPAPHARPALSEAKRSAACGCWVAYI